MRQEREQSGNNRRTDRTRQIVEDVISSNTAASEFAPVGPLVVPAGGTPGVTHSFDQTTHHKSRERLP
eukprot:122894-Pyramimonas_sp.AAC.1